MKQLLLSFLVIFSLSAVAQQPPLLNSYAYTNTDWSVDVCINYLSNDTGTVLVQFQLAADETGNIVLDQYFTVPADKDTACLHLWLPYSCQRYLVTMNMSNSHAYGPIQNPLFTFNAGCTSGISRLNDADFSVVSLENSVQINSNVVVQNSSVEIFDLLGRKVTEASLVSQQQQIVVNETPGLYLLKISSPQETLYTTKVVVR